MIKTILQVKMHTDRVLKRVAKKKRRVLFGLGGYSRKVLRSSFKTSDKPSKPGFPPRVRSKDSPLRQLVVFSVDLVKGVMICGPKLFKSSRVDSREPLPELLDTGGRITIQSFGKPVTVDVEPRPYRTAAQEKAQVQFFKLLESVPL